MKHKITTILTLLLLIQSLCANALGVQEIKVFSALNQPLKARIGLISVAGLDPRDIKVRLAAPKVFNDAGIARPYFLTRLKYEPAINPDGSAYIKVTSEDIVREPYLDFFLEVSWRGGSLVKEYAILLDPIIIQQAPVTAQPQAPAKPTTKQQVYGPVKRAETLWAIAKNTRPDTSISINQMIDAIHRKNPNAFVGGDINKLKQGEMLSIPNAATIYDPAVKMVETQIQKQKKSEPAPQSAPIAIEQAEPEPVETGTATKATSSEMPEPAAVVEIPAPKPMQPEATEATATTQTEPAADTPEQAEQPKLKVVATPEAQLKEVLQTQDNKAYPKSEIEQLHESISDTEQDITALGSINQDLVRLRAALQAKIALVQKELDKTNQAIAIVSGQMEDSESVPDSDEDTKPETEITAEPDPIPEPAPEKTAVEMETTMVEPEAPETEMPKVEQPPTPEVSTKAPEGVSPSVISKINEPETATEEVAGTEIKTDLAEIARIKKLEQEIELLKSQGETLQIQKYLIIALALAFLAAFTIIIVNNRRGRPTDKGHPSTAEVNRYQQPAPEPEPKPEPEPEIKSDFTTSEERSADTTSSKHGGYNEVISQAEHPAALTNRFETQVQDKPESGPNIASPRGNQPSPNTLLFESSREEPSHEEPSQDVNSIMTTVDVYLAYRRLTEAESILHNSIDNHPELPELKAKLLEVYAFKKDTQLFTRYLERYQEELTSKTPKLWENILALAAKLIPGHPSIADITANQTGEPAISGASSNTPSDSGNIDIGADALVDELVIGDIHTSEDELFRVDKEEPDSFDIDLDTDDFNKS